ncbi:hypothetical protein A9Q99_08230 [Gammaproteobacteria bacterium 45_16_T64]|nr:hypothetical protein A9Q99_08230 [Gammaproteobacteria bacterium 45_16_T64]
MSSLSSLYNSLSGLAGFTKALDNLSNNVANLNTPGYKGRDVFYRELAGGNPEQGVPGNGVEVGGGSIRFADGDTNQTGNATDLAVDGNGFFILRDQRDGVSQTYTRAGQFTFDADGYLIDASTEKRVAGINESGNLTDINIQDYRFSDPIVTSVAKLTGGLSSSATEGSVYPADDETPIELSLFDDAGRSVNVKLLFKKLEGRDWEVSIVDENDVQVAASQTLEFSDLGNPVTATHTFLRDIQLFNVLDELDYTSAFSAGEEVAFTDGTPESGDATSFEIDDAFFVTRDNGDIHFSNTGVYTFDDDGLLTDADTGFAVAAVTDAGGLEDFSLADSLTTPAVATTSVNIVGNIDASVENGIEVPSDTEDPFTFEVMGPEGELRTIQLQFLKESLTGWSVIAKNDIGGDLNNTAADGSGTGVVTFNAYDETNDALDGNVIPSQSEVIIEYAQDGHETFDFTLSFVDENGDSSFTAINEQVSDLSGAMADGKEVGVLTTASFDEDGIVTVNYSNGEVEVLQRLAVVDPQGQVINDVEFDFSGVASQSTTSSIEVSEIDGRSKGLLSDSRFDENGQLILSYSNEDVYEAEYVALAHFSDLGDLVSVGDTQFRLSEGGNIIIGRPNDEGLGKIQGGAIELSNVELSREFADIIIVQRGYQASSQVLNVTNQILEELYNSVKGR